MKTCLIFGRDGLDLDVTLNLRSFYKSIGFRVFFSEKKLYDSDLLVLIRADNNQIDLSNFHYSLIHVYDYVGWDYDAFIKNIDYSKTFIFCTSKEKRERLIHLLQFPKEQVFIALPPVEVKLWTEKIEEVKYEIVHIGNFKPITNEDQFKKLFNEVISHFKTNVWGVGWKINKDLYHGKTSLFSVSSIYSKSKFALGLMYPFQRNVTFSGRFWQAPLNGCFVFSEPGLYTQNIPGVIETDYSIKNIETEIISNVDRIALQKEATIFWIKKYEETKTIVLSTLENFNLQRFSLNKFLVYAYISMKNYMRIYYQKMSLFKIIKK
jgi:hypothetical protein